MLSILDKMKQYTQYLVQTYQKINVIHTSFIENTSRS